MAWAEQVRSGRWQGRYRDTHGVRRSAGTFPHKARALREASSAEKEERDTPSPMESQRITWGLWEPRWAAGRVVAPSTAANDEKRLRLHVRPRWAQERLRSITPDDVQLWVRVLSDGSPGRKPLAPASVMLCYRLLSSSMRAAVGARLLTVSPCREIRLPRSGPAPDRYLTDVEQAAIVEHLDDRDAFAVELLVGTGMRLGEALGLHWENVDLARGRLSVVHAYDKLDHKIKPPKSYARRTVPLSKALVALLAAELAERGQGSACPVPHRDGRCRTGLVLPGVQGRPMAEDRLRRRWEVACSWAVVATADTDLPVGHVRLHDLRHTYASRLVRAAVPLLEVKRLLGHGSITTTERYSHLGDTQWDAVQAVLDAVHSGAVQDRLQDNAGIMPVNATQ